MLLLAIEEGHFPFRKGTFSHHFKSWGVARALARCAMFVSGLLNLR